MDVEIDYIWGLEAVENFEAGDVGERTSVFSEVAEELRDREEDCSVVFIYRFVFIDAEYTLLRVSPGE